MIDIKTIIVHCKKLKDRKQNILEQMNKYEFINYEFFEDYDAIDLTENEIKQYYCPYEDDKNLWNSKVSLWGSDALSYHNKKCTLPEISLSIKYGKIFNKYKNLDPLTDDYLLLFEDDVILCEDFSSHFYNYLSRTPDDWDAIYIGSGAGLKPKNINSSQTVYAVDHPASRCTDSMLFKLKTIKDLASTWFPFNLSADWEIATQHHKHNHKVYWWEPGLVMQGSEHGLYESSIR